MYKIITFLILLQFLSFSALGQTGDIQRIADSQGDSIDSVAVMPGGDQVVVSVKSGSAGKLLIISLRECAQKRRFVFDKPITSIMASPSDSGAVWGGQGAYLKKWSTLDGKELYSVNITHEEPILGMSVSATGTHLAVWSRSEMALVDISGDSGRIIWSETTRLNISNIAVDADNGFVYIGAADGTLVKKSFQGAVANSFSLERPIKSLAIDTRRQILIMGMGSDLLKFDGKNSLFTRISSLPANDVALSNDGNTLYLIGSGSYSLFSYPQMKLIHMQMLKGNKLLVMSNGSSVTFDNNILEFFDFVKKQPAGKVFIVNDTVGFLSPDMNYYGGDEFRRAIENSLVPGIPFYLIQDRQPDQQKACYGLKSMMNSVYMPSVPTQSRPTVSGTSEPSAPSAPSVAAPSIPPVAAVPPSFVPPPLVVSGIGTTQGTTMPTAPVIPSAILPVTAPQMPIVQNVAPPVLAPGAEIPSWVMRPGSLPPFSSVKSGSDAASALRDAKIKIREDVARSVMKNMLEVQMVTDIQADEVKKRFLWMVAGRAAQLAAEYVIQADMWVSPEGTFYVLGQVDTDTVNQIYDPVFQEEMKQLKTYGNTQYLSREPVKWD